MFEILTAVLKTGAGALINLLLGMVTTKLFAVNLGPSGVGIYSLFRQARDMLIAITTLNSGSVVIHGLTTRQEEKRLEYSAIILVVLSGCSLLVVLGIVIFAEQFATLFLHQSDPQTIIGVRWLSLSIVFGSGLFYFGSILNGYRAIGRLAISQMVVSLATLLLAYPVILMVRQGYTTAFLFMMAISSFTGMIFAIIFLNKARWLPRFKSFRFTIMGGEFKKAAREFFAFALTTLVTGFAYTGTNLLIRGMIVRRFNLGEAGIFDVSWTVSMLYMTLILNSFGTYYLPALTHLKSNLERNRLIIKMMRFTLMSVIPMIIGVILFKPLVIKILYDQTFLPALGNIRWMLIGDYLKAFGWVLGMIIFSVADKRALLVSELLWQTIFLLISTLSINSFSTIEGVGIGFAISYAFYLIGLFLYARRRFNITLNRSFVIRWLIGLAIIIGASYTNWSKTEISWINVIFWGIVVVVFLYFSFSTSEWHELIELLKRQKNRMV
jgi:O-antigen/teichoic acid export membrane protein